MHCPGRSHRGAAAVGLKQGAHLPDLLAASFDAFEAIRRLARQSEGLAPDLFAAFMTAADGRDAITAAPALPSAGNPARHDASPAGQPDPLAAADSIAVLAAILATRLDHAASLATTPGDQLACQDGAQAARRIHQLMTAADDAHVW